MKACIVSLFGYFNYGNRLQSFAVQEIIKKMGFQTKVIYIQSDLGYFHQSILYRIIGTPIYQYINGNQENKIYHERMKSFIRFNRMYIKTKRYNSIQKIHSHDADCFILGSDQVWNPTRYDEIKKKLYFLTFANPEQKICLSPSFGIDKLPEAWKPYFREQLNTFSKLSVREEAGARIIKELTGRESEVLIDPTLMFDKEEWRRIERQPKKVKTDCPYILTNFLGPRPQKAIEDINELSEKFDGKVYHLQDIRTPELFIVDPSEFLYLLDHASLILTDSFHTCVFSFLFGKPFLIYEREGICDDMISRLESFLDTFNLRSRFRKDEINSDIFECDYRQGYVILEKERQKMLRFLESSLSAIKR